MNATHTHTHTFTSNMDDYKGEKIFWSMFLRTTQGSFDHHHHSNIRKSRSLAW